MCEDTQIRKEVTGRILSEIQRLLKEKGRILVAVDGRCGSGKTTLAASLQKSLSCNLIHMDSFYLRREQRTKERRQEPGGNVDYERFLSEVLLPLKAGKPFSYRPFDCATMDLSDPVKVSPANVELIEGSYSCHPTLYTYYDLRIFLTVSPEEQMRRIIKRNGAEKARQFGTLWIPLEELYFSNIPVEEHCDLCFDMS